MSDDSRIETLGHDSLAYSQENLHSVDKPTVNHRQTRTENGTGVTCTATNSTYQLTRETDMTDHDSLCISTVQDLISAQICTLCEVIRDARKDERQKIVQEIHKYRVDTLPLISDSVSPYVTGLIRAEIIASGRKHYE